MSAFAVSGRSFLRPSHQPERSRQPQAALPRQRDAFELAAVFRARSGESDPDLIAAEDGVLAFRRRVLRTQSAPRGAASANAAKSDSLPIDRHLLTEAAFCHRDGYSNTRAGD